MTVLSKFCGDKLGLKLLTTNCYETTHTWNPSCWGALTDIIWEGYCFSFRTYFTVYMATTMLSVRGDVRKIEWKRLLRDAAQSAAFLTFNLIGYLFWLCRFRKLFGFYVWPSAGLFNGLLSSFGAILVEQKKRRGMLALYLTNLASETAFRMLVNHGYLKSIPNGECLVFSAAMAGYMHLLRNGNLDQSTAKIFKMVFAIGPDSVLNLRKFPKSLANMFGQLRNIGGKHSTCEHKHSCISAAVEPFCRNMVIGCTGVFALRLLTTLPRLFTSPRDFLSQLTTFSNFRLPLFVGSLPVLYHSTACLLRRHFGGDRRAFAAISGAISGASMLFFPNVSIAMYALWKMIETVYFLGVKAGKLPNWRHGDVALYTISTGFVLFSACIEPHSLRSGYYKFLVGLSGNRANQINRKVLDVFGFDSSRLFSNYWPVLDPTRTTMYHHH